jgi:drug/metabolite transporter (DMT)-like permease
MLAFAANSVLARLAFATADAEPLSYTGIRLASGAAVLFALLVLRRRSDARATLGGSWAGAAALFGYALAFSIAYIMLGAGTGALILFASVQIGILGWAVFRGDRPGTLEWLGLVIALAAFAYLVSPGLVAPDPLGTLLMIGSGLCWAAYTLLGRGSKFPLVDTAGNFIRCLPVAFVAIVAGLLLRPVDPAAAAYAVASGALASGLGYAIWYAVLPNLARTSAAIVQLTVPAIAAAGGALLIGEPLTLRLLLASIGILGGVALALLAAERRRRAAAG